MINIIISFAFLFLLNNFLNADNLTDDKELQSIINNVKRNYLEKEIYNVNLIQEHKPYYSNDTIKNNYNIYYYREKRGNFLLLKHKSNIYFNMDNKTYQFNLKDSILIIQNDTINNKKILKNKTYLHPLFLFISGIYFDYYFNNYKNVKLIKERIKNRNFWKIIIYANDQKLGEHYKLSNIRNEFLVDANTFEIVKITQFMENDGFLQYQSWYLKENHTKISGLKGFYKLFDNYKDMAEECFSIKENSNVIKKDFNSKKKFPFKVGDKFWDLSLLLYPNLKKIMLGEVNFRLAFIEFWYLSCAPCNMSLGHLIQLQKKYKDNNFTVIGVNYYDLKRYKTTPSIFNKFVDKKKINFPIAFIEDSLQYKYNIKEFPTYFLIDSNLKILYYDSGFNDIKYHKIDKKIFDYIKNK